MIHVDIHERKTKQFNKSIPRLLQKYGVPIEKKLLDVGDYVIIGPSVSVCTESKTAGDYIGSINSGIINNELFQISSNYDYGVLLIHGDPTAAMLHRKVKRSSWYNFLAGCVLETSPVGKQAKISVIHVETPHDAVNFLRTLHKKVMTDDTIREPTAQKVDIPDDQKLLYCTRWLFPPDCHIGLKRAEQLLKKFGSINELCKATEEEIKSIDGFGDVISEQIVDHLHRRFENG